MPEVTMKAPDGVTSAGVAGVEYKVSRGRVRVALTHVAQLVEHGFEVVVDDIEKVLRGRRNAADPGEAVAETAEGAEGAATESTEADPK